MSFAIKCFRYESVPFHDKIWYRASILVSFTIFGLVRKELLRFTHRCLLYHLLSIVWHSLRNLQSYKKILKDKTVFSNAKQLHNMYSRICFHSTFFSPLNPIAFVHNSNGKWINNFRRGCWLPPVPHVYPHSASLVFVPNFRARGRCHIGLKGVVRSKDCVKNHTLWWKLFQLSCKK